MNTQRIIASFALVLSLASQAQTSDPQPKAFDPKGCASQPILERFEDFGRTGRMPPDLGRWLSDPAAQYVAPYKAFDNVYFVACVGSRLG